MHDQHSALQGRLIRGLRLLKSGQRRRKIGAGRVRHLRGEIGALLGRHSAGVAEGALHEAVGADLIRNVILILGKLGRISGSNRAGIAGIEIVLEGN